MSSSVCGFGKSRPTSHTHVCDLFLLTPFTHLPTLDVQVYSRLRQEAARTHGMPIAVRHLESLIRMSEAHARMHMREFVSDDDINMAIK